MSAETVSTAHVEQTLNLSRTHSIQKYRLAYHSAHTSNSSSAVSISHTSHMLHSPHPLRTHPHSPQTQHPLAEGRPLIKPIQTVDPTSISHISQTPPHPPVPASRRETFISAAPKRKLVAPYPATDTDFSRLSGLCRAEWRRGGRRDL